MEVGRTTVGAAGRIAAVRAVERIGVGLIVSRLKGYNFVAAAKISVSLACCTAVAEELLAIDSCMGPTDSAVSSTEVVFQSLLFKHLG